MITLSEGAVKTEASVYEQLEAFWYSVILGVCAGAGYDVIKIIRLCLCRKRLAVFLLDFAYTIPVSIAVFIFSVAYMNGVPRFFIALGAALGFTVFRLSAGRLLGRLYLPLIALIKKVFLMLSEKIKKIIKKLLKKGNKILYNKSVKGRISMSGGASTLQKAVDFEDEEKSKKQLVGQKCSE